MIVGTDPKSSTVVTYFTIFIAQNSAPLAVRQIEPLSTQLQMYFQYQIPDNVFRDPNNDALTYKLVPYQD